MANKKILNIINHREMQIKTTRYDFSPSGMAEMKNSGSTRC